jgi:HEAT repeat protein
MDSVLRKPFRNKQLRSPLTGVDEGRSRQLGSAYSTLTTDLTRTQSHPKMAPMRPKGKRITVVAVVLGLAAIAGTAFALHERIIEEWHIHRLRSGGDTVRDEQFSWMAEHGEEASWLALAELLSRPEQLRLLRAGLDGKLAIYADVEIEKHLGPERLEAVMTRTLNRETSPPEVQIFIALNIIFSRNSKFAPITFDLAVSRVCELLSNPDPLIRQRAASVLSGAGERARSCLPALQKLKDDPDPEVRKAATMAIKRLSK